MTRPYTFIFMILIFAISCSPAERAEETTEAPAGEVVELTEQQKAEGWKPLFNGTDLSGWRTFKHASQNSWEIHEGGVLHCKAFDDAQERADLLTEEQFRNFELSFDWKISPQGNSGVMFRVTEDEEQPYFTGPEYQLLDDEGYPGDVKEVHLSGGCYDMLAPALQAAKPVGEWNASRLLVDGNHVEHWLNGTKVAAYDIGSDDWKARKENSKWKDVEGYAAPLAGHIDLQDHKQEAWFKNILIRVLPD